MSDEKQATTNDVVQAQLKQFGTLTQVQRQGLIICITNDIGGYRRNLSHDFNVDGLYTTTIRAIRLCASDERVQRLMLCDLLEGIVRDFLSQAAQEAAESLDQEVAA